MPYTEDGVPYVNRDTSRKAAEAISEEDKLAGERLVLSEIEDAGEHGRCCWEMQETLGMMHETCSARIDGLYKKKLIYDAGVRRVRPLTGNQTIAWRRWTGPPELRPPRPEPKFKRLCRQLVEQLVWYSGFQGQSRPGYELTDQLIIHAKKELGKGR